MDWRQGGWHVRCWKLEPDLCVIVRQNYVDDAFTIHLEFKWAFACSFSRSFGIMLYQLYARRFPFWDTMEGCKASKLEEVTEKVLQVR